MLLPDLQEDQDVAEPPTTTDSPETPPTTYTTVAVISISLNALVGSTSFQTLQLTGRIKNRNISMLVDSGSTHNFLDAGTAKALGCTVIPTSPHSVTVVGGGTLQCSTCCPSFTWEIQGSTFVSDVRILPLGGCDLVLGVQWLREISPVLMDFTSLQMEFQHNNHTVQLRGDTVPAKAKLMSLQAAQRMVDHHPMTVMGLLTSISDARGTVDREVTPPAINELLSEFQDVFQEPHELPPSRSIDHTIQLKEGNNPTQIRPYRYPQFQKSEIERQVQKFLEAGLIQPSQSPFNSPSILVRKKDGTWRMCVDYRRLNSCTIRNPFPIPIIEELLDELAGATIFSRLDLKARYHQILVAPSDIPKTAFSTHSRHFEFKVMPFGLTNAPATFQCIMNEIFHNHLRHFILVFVDDILVYSPTLESHIHHLHITLSFLRSHKLKANQAKCAFGQSSLDYLGHIISSSGISADPLKIEVVQQWPHPKSLKAL
ncbi:hypothetical protein ACHQM5_000724 [Ranunculus cassubicifolius]